MRRRWIWPVLLVLVMGLTACQVEITPTPKPDGSNKTSDPAPVPPPPDSGTADPDTGNAAKPGLSGGIAGSTTPVQPDEPAEPTVPDDSEEDPSGGNTDYTMEKYRRYLSGQWIAVEGEVEGDRYKMEEVGMTVTLEFQEADGVTEDGRGTWSMGAWYEYTNKYGDHEKLDGLNVKFLEGPMYYGCGNDEWYAELMSGQDDVPEDVEYTVTVIDNNYLELQRYVEDSYTVWTAYCQRADGRWIED